MGDKSTSVAALDGNSTAASQTIDELLTSAAWVTSLTDPALHLDRLHETFTRVIFSCVDVEEGNEPARRLVTAAERLREEREKEELRRELRELQDNTFVDDEDEDVGGLDEGSKLEDDHYTDEEFSEASVLMNDGEFFEWIHRNDTQTLEQRADVVDETGLSGVGIELELQRVGLSEEDRKVTEDILPERLKAIEVGEQRHHLGSRLLPHGYSYRIPIESEAFWVLCQLRGAGQPLAHNTRICALAARSPSEVSDEPVVVAIAYALRKMTREFLEPGHLMLYHQTPLHPLLCALLESSPLVDSAERTLPVASYAYSTLTGRRQRPYISDMFSRLPILRKRLFDLFCAEGDLIVTYKDCGRQDDIYPIASFFAEHARHYLELLERERQGSLELFYVINDDLVRGAVDFKRLYDCSFKGGNDLQNEDEWSVSREGAMNLLLMRLVDGLVPKVKGELGQFANRRVQAQSVERLGLLCAQGPYEATRLCLSAYDKDSLLWEPEWNIVEALPEQREKVSLVHSYGRRPAARVCAVYRGEGGVASISFIDEDGTFISSMRWADCELSSESGRVADEEQKNQFEKIFEHCNPNVIAVGAANISSLSLMQSIMRFVRERVYAKRHIHVPVVWAPVEVARLYSSTAYAEQETPNTDHVLRVSLALARYVQDPLSALVVLFDKGRTALRLSLGSVVNTSEQEAQLYARLCWEMSLWVTACGVWVDDCATRVHYASLLQFVAGVGPTRARKLQQILTSERPTSREACYQLIVSCFGEHVARNAACALRIGPVVDNGGTTTLFPSSSLPSEFRWQMMDQTLVPTSWYAVAALIARVGLKQKIPASLSSMPLMDSGVVALANFMGRSAQEKRASFDLHANQKDILLVIRAAQNPEWNSLLGEREVEFIQEEMISAGRSFMRRPYRRLSSRELMFCLTGITFCSKRDAAYGHRPMDSQSLYIYRDPEKSFNSNDTHHAKGNASGLVTVAENDDDENNYVSYAARGVPVPSCATSLRTVRLDMDVRVFATKVSRHPLFRDASSSMALKFLQDKKIGEVLLRPVVGRRSKVIAVVKIGDRSMCNWLVSEERRPNGAIYYLMTDKVTRRSTEYNDVDEFLNNFIAPMVTLVQGIRSHRRFVDNVRNVSEALGMQRRNNAKDGEVSSGGAAVFAYAFVEVGQQSIPPFYRVFTRAGTTERNYYLHIDDSSIYVRVPVRRSNTSGDVSVKWVNCRNAEHVGEVVKRLAEAR
uniref:Transcription elongation factor SPT6 n=1 Tax=Trypanosoma vivax (strain Y486) TaxID=1055687 RepID=G0TS61_TRYVY|nr:conserved hypothetical protein, fragment [Trypanosoma vivax Y486]